MKGGEDGDRRRRSPRLHSQTHASDEAVGVTRRHPQVHASEEGAGVARGRPRSQIHAIGEGAGAIRRSRRRRGSFPVALASPLEDDDLLTEILHLLPPQPSSLLRASAVCKQWRCAATDPKFLHRFRIHHQKPPLLGVFHQRNNDDIVFTSILDPPDRIPSQRFDLQLREVEGRNRIMSLVKLLDCRNGRVLLIDQGWGEIIVCDPITGEQHSVPIPPEFQVDDRINGAVLCAASDHDHVHGSCHSSPFKVVLVSDVGEDRQLIACVYSSETGIWGDIISAAVSFLILVSLGCLLRNINCHGVATWVLRKIIDMRTILGFSPHIQGEKAGMRRILGCVEDTDGILLVLSVGRSAYMVQLKSMKSRKLCENSYYTHYHSFKSFYLPVEEEGLLQLLSLSLSHCINVVGSVYMLSKTTYRALV